MKTKVLIASTRSRTPSNKLDFEKGKTTFRRHCHGQHAEVIHLRHVNRAEDRARLEENEVAQREFLRAAIQRWWDDRGRNEVFDSVTKYIKESQPGAALRHADRWTKFEIRNYHRASCYCKFQAASLRNNKQWRLRSALSLLHPFLKSSSSRGLSTFSSWHGHVNPFAANYSKTQPPPKAQQPPTIFQSHLPHFQFTCFR